MQVLADNIAIKAICYLFCNTHTDAKFADNLIETKALLSPPGSH